MTKNRQILILYSSLMVVTLMAFWQVSRCDFINYDDPKYVVKNDHIQQGITMEGIRWAAATTYAANWHPLTWMSHMLDIQLFGLYPGWHHVTNLGFHIANTLLLFFVLHRMTKAYWQSAVVAALFALHPLHVESVAWVAERKDVLSTFFWLLTMGAYSYYVERPGMKRYIPVLSFFVLGLMAKPMVVTLPFVLLLLDYWPLQRFWPQQADREITNRTGEFWSEDRRQGGLTKKRSEQAMPDKTSYDTHQWAFLRPLLWEKTPLFFFAILSSIVTYIAQQEGGAVQSIETYPLQVRIANAFISYLTYIGKMVWPRDLAILYPYQRLWTFWQAAGAVVLFVAVTFVVIRTARSFPYLFVGWLWYLGTLVPVIGIVQVGIQARADRYTYIPLIGMFIVVAWGVTELLKQWRYRKVVLFASSAFMLFCFFLITRTQVGYWQNSITLFDRAVKVTDRNSIAYLNLGEAYSSRGDQRQAIDSYDKAIAFKPEYVEAYYNRGNAYGKLGDDRQAIDSYDRAIKIYPKYSEAYYNRGVIYEKLGDDRHAIDSYDKAIEFNPEYAEAYYNRGNAYGKLGNERKAINNYDKAIEINPRYAEAYYNRAIAYGKLGNERQALVDGKTAARLGNEVAQDILIKMGVTWQ
jgi:Tfp pilus assembly protein PilF